MRLIKRILTFGLFGISIAAASEPDTTVSMLSRETQSYLETYDSSFIRDFKFKNQSNPQKSACEDMCLEAQLAARAEADGLTSNSELLEKIRLRKDHEILDLWLHQEIGSPSSDQLLDYYTHHKQEFVRPAQVTFHHLFLLVLPGDDDGAKSQHLKARELSKQARQMGNFETLFSNHSELETAKKDKGKVGPVELEKLNPEIRYTLKELEPGEISAPIRTPYGWEVLRLDSITPETEISFENARGDIEEILFSQQVDKLKQSAATRLSTKYPVHIKEGGLDNQNTDLESIVFSVGDNNITLGQTSRTVQGMNVFQEVSTVQERIEKFLPQLTLMEQIRLSARGHGILESHDFRIRERITRNRALSEAYLDKLITRRIPSEEEILEAYNAEKDIFRGPAYAKGILYRWKLMEDNTISTSTADRLYRQRILNDEITSLITQLRNGDITTETLASNADETKALDWFREGPMGYYHDMAWFKTESGQFTKPYVVKDNMYIAYVEDRKEPEQFPLERVHQQVRTRLMNKWTKDERKAMINNLLRNCNMCD